MAESDGLKQTYNVPAVAGVRQGYVFAKNRQKKQDRKKQEQHKEPGKEEASGDDKKHVDIKV
jgi:hypothetical protein